MGQASIFIKGSEWQRMPDKLKDDYVEELYQYWRQYGFPYYRLTDSDIVRQFRNLESLHSDGMFLPNNEIQWSNVGLALANHFHPQMWSIRSDSYLSPVQCFYNDDMLKACIRRALEIWHTRYGANPSNLRRMLSSFTNVKRVSNFRPTVAKAICERYSRHKGSVLDFSAGFGGRLLGCLALERTYVGYEASWSQFDGLRQMYNKLRDLKLPWGSAILRLCCAEDAIREERTESYDLVFTSPPYFNRERYSGGYEQSYIRYPDYVSWRQDFLGVVITESYRVLRKDGKLVINVANTENAPVADDTVCLASRYFNLVKTYWLRLGRLPYRVNASASAYHYEPVFVFAKQR